MANLRGHFDIYNQHFTCAIVKIWNPSIEYHKEEWKKKVVEDFMNLNILTKEDIKATFTAGKLEQSENGENHQISYDCAFKEKSKTLISISSYHCRSKRKNSKVDFNLENV